MWRYKRLTSCCVAGVRGAEEHQGVGCGLHVTPHQEGHCQLHPRVQSATPDQATEERNNKKNNSFFIKYFRVEPFLTFLKCKNSNPV